MVMTKEAINGRVVRNNRDGVTMRKVCVKGLALTTVVISLMTGCGSEQVNLTSEQETQVGEYAAMALLRHDANNRSRLVSAEEVEAIDRELLQKEQEKQEQEQNQDTEETAEGMGPVEDTPVIEKEQESTGNTVASLGEFFGLAEGVTIVYRGEEICDSYPGDENESAYFSLDATAGKRLMVLRFDITNQSQSEQAVDVLSQNAIIKITVNENYTRYALTTMLMDDLSTYKGTIPAGDTVSLVLLTELDNETAESVSTVSLSLKKDTSAYKEELQ